jgi:AraC family transcriptional regulator
LSGHCRPILEGSFLSLWDWHCSGRDSNREEKTSAHFEIVLVRRGAFQRTAACGRTVADRTVASFWSADEEFRIRHLDTKPDRCTIFRLSHSSLGQLLETIAPDLNDLAVLRFQRPHVALSSNLYLRHLQLLQMIDAGEEPLALEETASELAECLIAASTRRTHGSFTRDAARATAAEYSARVRELVTRRFLEPLSLAQIAREVCCSPFHLSRMVVAAEGIRIHQLIMQLRLRESLHRLFDTRDSIAVIAIETGFSSHSHFSAAFRRAFGMTPHEVRKRGGLRGRLAAPAWQPPI